jgi:nucleotide-binding universal stress UspA family protein
MSERRRAMQPVLLATDGSPTAEKATETAIELAQLLGTELVVVTVWTIPYTMTGLAPAPINGGLAELNEDEARKLVLGVAARAEEAGVVARTHVLRGIPVEEICAAAATYRPRFLVVGSHGWGVVRRAVFGSVSTGVLHRAKCPVLVVRGEPTEPRSTTNGRANVRVA